MKTTRLFYSAILLAWMVTSFQNCSGPMGSAGSLTLESVPGGPKALGLYDLSNVQSIHYSYRGGLMPGPAPDVTVSFIGIPSVSATFYQWVSIPGEPDQACTNYNPLTSAQVAVIQNALSNASLALAPMIPNLGITDCSTAYLDVYLKDSSMHSYIFQSDCTYQGELSISDPQHVLSTLINGYLANSCLPAPAGPPPLPI